LVFQHVGDVNHHVICRATDLEPGRMCAAVGGGDFASRSIPPVRHEPRIQFAGIMAGVDEIFTRRDDVPPCGLLLLVLAADVIVATVLWFVVGPLLR
jgi:hypothetical protein